MNKQDSSKWEPESVRALGDAKYYRGLRAALAREAQAEAQAHAQAAPAAPDDPIEDVPLPED